ncbi:cytochrome P450 [Mycolicibacterium mageritense DSM 44476 = CIP 104973]|uniref:Cytochrome P450 monooxygenase n=1 Tax=Mycolicibacterium mageritense TaxID=53462 RepID=A0ABN5YAJ7_MYCME|nr:cytochrome P450 [Mycolicibacterium mageritense]MCC9183854.1 cytochrome P450 [Mycolicibacterium mageritense]BBX34791.1 cytochrome P450 monooxygenase [Mycolicibacterium mageritense]CDO20690.1 cytochrome P450 [Mycolicibacterium mageritense DSM 44476 = CIP 104973]
MTDAAHAKLPPGPRLPRSVQAALMMRHWPRYVSACRRRYGDVFTVRVASFGTMVYLADPADIKTVFAGDPAIYHAGEANSVLSTLLGDTSVLVVDGDVHRDRRRLMLPPFHRDAVARQAAVMAEVAADNVARWPVGTPFAAAPKMAEITLEVILRTVIGASDPARLDALRTVLPRLLSVGSWDLLAIASPGLLRRRPWQALRRDMAEADWLLYAEIAERRADPDLENRTDVLAMLVRGGDGMTDVELRDQLMTLLVAGHETTATGLSWALERLTRHPAVLDKAVRAARSGDDEYLDAVAKEVLRIRPVVFDVGRVLTRPVEVAGYLLPAGVMVAPGIGLVHASDTVYPDPGRFDPDRMVGVTLGPTTWFPFGGGNRRCLGATFAMVELRVVLREILCRADLFTTTTAGERQRVKHVTLVPHRGARICVRAMRDVPGHAASGTSVHQRTL